MFHLVSVCKPTLLSLFCKHGLRVGTLPVFNTKILETKEIWGRGEGEGERHWLIVTELIN